MTTEVDVANLALSHFGQEAIITSIDPPDGSAEALHARRFLPMARDELLELHPWRFAKKRAVLAALTNDRPDWGYKYALPTDCLRTRVVLPAEYDDEHDEGMPFDTEGSALYTDQEGAVLAYTARVTDPTKWSPLFASAMTWRLASYMSGPIIKDPSGKIQAALYQRALVEQGKAMASDANATVNRAEHTSTAQRARR